MRFLEQLGIEHREHEARVVCVVAVHDSNVETLRAANGVIVLGVGEGRFAGTKLVASLRVEESRDDYMLTETG